MNRYTLFRRLCLGLSVLCAAGLLYRRFRGILLAFLLAPEAASIGIIGGADGPTAIFVTSRFSPQFTQWLLVCGLVLGIVGFLLLRKPKE